MKNEIIRSESPLQRGPVKAFILSFLFTGLGQMYNGDLSKGIAFFMLRILTLITIPLYSTFEDVDLYPFFVVDIVSHIVIWLISSLEAMFGTRSKTGINLKRYNTLFFYFLYGILSSLLLLFSVLIVSIFINIDRVKTDRMDPTLMKDEYVLLNRYATANLDIGDVVVYTERDQSKLGRIIAKDGEIVNITSGNVYYVNEKALQLGILNNVELNKMGLENSEDLYYEISGNRKYPIKAKIQKLSSNLKKSRTIQVGDNMIFISSDNRTKNNAYELVNTSRVEARVEGILFSRKLSRLLLKPYLMN